MTNERDKLLRLVLMYIIGAVMWLLEQQDGAPGVLLTQLAGASAALGHLFDDDLSATKVIAEGILGE